MSKSLKTNKAAKTAPGLKKTTTTQKTILKKHNTGHGLGRGLGALIDSSRTEYNMNSAAGAETEPPKKEIPFQVDTELIIPNPYQPRKIFTPELLEELAASIKEHGIIQPLVVRTKGSQYELVAGERRWRAAGMLHLTSVPVLIRTYTDEQMMEIALVENIQRHNLNPLEEAQGIKQLMESCHLTQEQAAAKVGRSRTAVANLLRLLHLPKLIQESVDKETLTMGQVRPLLALTKEDQQIRVAQAAERNGWSARLVEKIVKTLKDGGRVNVKQELLEIYDHEQKHHEQKDQAYRNESKKLPELPKEQDVHYKLFEDELVTFLGTQVKVIPHSQGQGKIEISYSSLEDLERISELLQGKDEAAVSKHSLLPHKLTV